MNRPTLREYHAARRREEARARGEGGLTPAGALLVFIGLVFVAGFGAGLYAGMAVGHRDALATIHALKAEESRR